MLEAVSKYFYFEITPADKSIVDLYLSDIESNEIDTMAAKEMAIEILESPNSTEIQKSNALAFAQAYKQITALKPAGGTPSVEKAICINELGRRCDLQPR